ncbi:hypothetical protein [Pseudodesulfovibrio sp. JC047]|uniref:hypothetical protein n=1 Tax=Pseudodesulfovibrio sp. JC047 TaxID=2683199 RepID=UPI001EF234B2|nr:hypothetical protein [Pseudodesulfovibrio sp. JC047]
MTAKEIREDIARARAYAKKSDYLRTLRCLANAIRGLMTRQVFGAEKFEIHAHLDEALRDLNKMKMMQKLFPKGLKYEKGKEKAFYQTLMRLHKKLGEAMEKARVAKIRKRLSVLDDNLIKAANLAQSGHQLEARKLYSKISEYFQDIDGINSDIGNRMAMSGMFSEAVPYLLKALETQNNDARAHNALILSYEGMHETMKAIAATKDAMRWLGPSESLYLRLAKLHLAQREWGDVYNNAKSALDRNPLNAEAAKLMKMAEPKIFSSTKQSGGKGRTAKKVHTLNF